MQCFNAYNALSQISPLIKFPCLSTRYHRQIRTSDALLYIQTVRLSFQERASSVQQCREETATTCLRYGQLHLQVHFIQPTLCGSYERSFTALDKEVVCTEHYDDDSKPNLEAITR
jgi:hypothetical protein